MTVKKFFDVVCKNTNYALDVYSKDGKRLGSKNAINDLSKELVDCEVLSVEVYDGRFDVVVNRQPDERSLEERFADIMIYVPDTDEIIKISEGSGCNLDAEDEEDGYVDYIYYEQYDPEDFSEKDGGQIMRTRLLREMYYELKETIPDVLNMAYDNADLKYVRIR
jgi:hypothetical protein